MKITEQIEKDEMAQSYTSSDLDLDKELAELRGLYNKNVYPSLQERRSLLKAIENIMVANQDVFVRALSEDYGHRSEFDSMMMDIIPSVNYAKYMSKNIKKWMKKQKRHSTLVTALSKAEVYYQPVGVVGVVVPWNFPIYLALGPALTAIGAGNRVMVKLSEFTPNINKAMITAFASLSDHIRFYEGEVEVSSKFSSLPFDHLLFTGSTNVGKIVARAAADNLTPITLELGGKSPTIVTKNADLDTAVDSIIMGKSFNSGQICVSPDYLFIHSSLKDIFINKFKEKIIELYEGEKGSDHTHIINEQHYNRLKGYLVDANEKGGQVIEAVKFSKDGQFKIFPTLVDNVNDDMKIMQDEIFGSLFPIMTYEKIEEVYEYIAKGSRPLALYLFSNDKAEVERIITHTHSGGVCVNDAVLHVAADDAPFGGIGDSGMGQYHGHEGFLTFSKAKTVLKSGSVIPKNWWTLKYRDLVLKLLKRMINR